MKNTPPSKQSRLVRFLENPIGSGAVDLACLFTSIALTAAAGYYGVKTVQHFERAKRDPLVEAALPKARQTLVAAQNEIFALSKTMGSGGPLYADTGTNISNITGIWAADKYIGDLSKKYPLAGYSNYWGNRFYLETPERVAASMALGQGSPDVDDYPHTNDSPVCGAVLGILAYGAVMGLGAVNMLKSPARLLAEKLKKQNLPTPDSPQTC